MINQNDSKSRSKYFTFDGFNAIFACRPKKKGGGAAIFIKDTTNYDITDNFNTDENIQPKQQKDSSSNS